MVDLRSDLIESRSKNAVLEKELQNTLEQLHAAQLQVHATSGHDANAESVRKKLVGPVVCLPTTSVTFPVICIRSVHGLVVFRDVQMVTGKLVNRFPANVVWGVLTLALSRISPRSLHIYVDVSYSV